MNVKMFFVILFVALNWLIGIFLLTYVVPYLWSIYAALKAAQG